MGILIELPDLQFLNKYATLNYDRCNIFKHENPVLLLK